MFRRERLGSDTAHKGRGSISIRVISFSGNPHTVVVVGERCYERQQRPSCCGAKIPQPPLPEQNVSKTVERSRLPTVRERRLASFLYTQLLIVSSDTVPARNMYGVSHVCGDQASASVVSTGTMISAATS